MYRNEAFTESLYVDLSGVSLDSVFGMAALKDQLKKISESVVSDELSRAQLALDKLNGSETFEIEI